MGHHLFYRNLNGQAVSEMSYDQQMNIRIGTGLSYLVRAALVMAIGAAYFQLFWRTLLRTAVPLAVVDCLADLLGSPLSFFDSAALRANPVLSLVAAVSWLLPFATIVPPATLIILSVPVESYSMYPIAAIDFATGPMAALSYVSSGVGPNAGNISGYSMPSYEGASQPLTRLALATAMQGAIPNIPSPSENSSYSLDFDAPGVQCEAISVDILNGFTAVMNCSVIRGESSNDICPSSYYYMAWPPSTHAIIPFGNDSLRFGTGPWLVDSNVRSYGPYGSEPGAIFVAVDTQPPYGLKDVMVVLNCSLWNATYTVDFNFPAEGQRITILHAQYNQPVSVGVLDAFPYNTPLDLSAHGPHLSYQALMECLGNILVGR